MKYNTGPEGTMEFPRFTFNPKEGIDNPALVISDDPEPDQSPVPRLCQLKRKEGQSFGFHLLWENGCHGYVIRQVAAWSPAELSGLRDGDRVLDVNEEFVGNMEFPRVVGRIQGCGPQLVLLVLSRREYDQAVGRGQDLQALSRAQRGEACARPRLCHITRHPALGLGISVKPIDGQKGCYVVTTVPEGPAEKAGVCSGDKLVWMDGTMVSALTYSALSKTLKKGGDHVTFLVVDRETERSYIRRKLPVLPIMAGSHNLPHRPRTMRLVQGSDGYGFLLRQEKLAGGRIAHILREVDPGSPAEDAGMRDGDLLLAVNGEPSEPMEHEDIVRKVRKSGQRVSLTSISQQGRDFYRQLGISPLLFADDHLPDREETRSEVNTENCRNQDEHGSLPCPRLCVLGRGEAGFGFHLGCVQHEPGTFIGQVVAGGAGQRVGLWEGDVVVEVNGQNVETEYFEDVVMLIKKSGSSLRLLVVERSGYERLKQCELPIIPGVTLHSPQQVSEKIDTAFL